MESPEIAPEFVDYETAIKKSSTQDGLSVAYIKNELNDLAQLFFIYDMGKDHNKKLQYAVSYLEYLGTDTYTPEALKKEFYKLGVNYRVNSQADQITLSLSGLRENLGKGLELLDHLLSNAVADQETYDKYIQKVAKSREDNKASKSSILWNGLMSYAQYGEQSRLRDIYSIDELNEIDPNELVKTIQELKAYKYRIFYYGKDLKQATNALAQFNTNASELKDYPQKKTYERKENGGNVYFVDYDMVQSEMLFLSKARTFDTDRMAAASLFNTYFGSGLSSIVFQEIRESKSLAYSAFSVYSLASKKEDPDYVYAYIGTQANKMPQAVEAMMDLMTNMPEAQDMFDAAKEATLKKIAAERINKSQIFWSYERLQKRGLDKDIREEMYNTIKDMTLADLKVFFTENIKGQEYDIMVIGNKKDVNMKALSKLGKVEEMDVDYLFNYLK